MGYELGPVKPHVERAANELGRMFGIKTIGGYRADATDPAGHPAGLAIDLMTSSKSQGDALAAYARVNASRLGVLYVIWYQRIWSVERSGEGWRMMENRGSATANHMDHVHISFTPQPGQGGPPIQGVGYSPVANPLDWVSGVLGVWTDTDSWMRIVLFVSGGVLLLIGFLMLFKNQGARQATKSIARTTRKAVTNAG